MNQKKSNCFIVGYSSKRSHPFQPLNDWMHMHVFPACAFTTLLTSIVMSENLMVVLKSN